MLTHQKLEQLELSYFKEIESFLIKKEKKIIKGLESKNKTYKFWKNEFENTSRENYRSSALNMGAERIFYDLFPLTKKWKPNSSPIGSDLMYETKDAYLHIDVKTISVSGNFGDVAGKCQVEKNQTSYPAKNIKFSGPSLPTYYKNKPCLTYLIQVIHDSKIRKNDILAIVLICVPNGELYKYYKEKIIMAGKMGLDNNEKQKDFRYCYFKEPSFVLLSKENKEIFRISLIYFNNKNYTDLSEIRLLKNEKLIKNFKKDEK